MSQPPWENQPPPGWGPPPPPTQAPGQAGWGQDPYSPPWVEQGGAVPGQQAPGQGYPGYQGGGHQQNPFPQNQVPQNPPPPHQYGQVQYPQSQYPQNDYPEPVPPPRRGNGGRTAGIVGVVVLLLAGAATVFALSRKNDSGPADTAAGPAATTAPATTPATTMTFPDSGFPGSGAPTTGAPGTTAPPDGSTTGAPAVDPASLDSATTDKTPFTAAGLVAPQFKDDKNVVYKLAAASPKPCDKVGDKAVAAIVTSAKCTQFFAASWTDASGRIIVSTMVIPYQDAATATQIADKLGNMAHTADYNQWCPAAGQPHSDVCAKLTPAATREGKFGGFHRYVLITTAVFSDLRNDDSVKDWLTAAAAGAFQNTLPGMS